MSLTIVFAIGALGLSIYNSISYNVEVAKYIYMLIGIFLIPLEFVLTDNFGKLQEQDGNLVGLIVSMVLVVFAIVVLVNVSKRNIIFHQQIF